MALVKCKECGQPVSIKAKTCPHCGVRNPAPFGLRFKRGLKLVAVCAVVSMALGIIIGIIFGAGSNSTASNTGGSTVSSPPPPVFAGNNGQITGVALGCPQKADLTAFMNDYSKALTVNDTVGEQNAIEASDQAGCTFIPKGTKALVITNSGFLEQMDQIRLDSGQAYWISADTISPIPGQPDNP